MLLHLRNQPIFMHLFVAVLIITGLYMGLSREFGGVPHPIDKIGHFGSFAFFTLVFGRYLGSFFVAMFMTVTASYLLELGQLTLDYRHFDYADVTMNSSGALFIWIMSVIVALSLKCHKYITG